MSITAVEHLRPEPLSPLVLWNGDGTYTPRCNVCDYTGKPRWNHGAARGAARQHATGVHHRARVKRTKGLLRPGVRAVSSVIE